MDTFIGSDLRIKMSPNKRMRCWVPRSICRLRSAMEGLPVLNETRFIRNGCRVVSLKFISDALTAFTIRSPEAVNSLGMSCTSGLIVQRSPTSLC
jgi:hypothetical protein